MPVEPRANCDGRPIVSVSLISLTQGNPATIDASSQTSSNTSRANRTVPRSLTRRAVPRSVTDERPGSWAQMKQKRTVRRFADQGRAQRPRMVPCDSINNWGSRLAVTAAPAVIRGCSPATRVGAMVRQSSSRRPDAVRSRMR